MSAESTLQTGCDLVTRATEEDGNRNYEEALRLYKDGVECLLQTIKRVFPTSIGIHDNLIRFRFLFCFYVDMDEFNKNSLRNKCLLYLDRAEKLEEYLNQGKKKPFKEGRITSK